MGNLIRTKIVNDVNKAMFWSIMIDEATDSATLEQLSVCVRFLEASADNKINVREDFLGFIELEKANAAAITDAMTDTTAAWGLDMEKLRGKGMDGASTMSGHATGVQERLRTLYPKAKYFTHCRSHCLNLVVVASCHEVR